MMLAHSPHALSGTRAPLALERGIAGIAIRLGRAIELWGRRRAALPDRDVRVRHYENLIANERRATAHEHMLARSR